MPKYRFTPVVYASLKPFEFEAHNEKEALAKAEEMFEPEGLCWSCSGRDELGDTPIFEKQYLEELPLTQPPVDKEPMPDVIYAGNLNRWTLAPHEERQTKYVRATTSQTVEPMDIEVLKRELSEKLLNSGMHANGEQYILNEVIDHLHVANRLSIGNEMNSIISKLAEAGIHSSTTKRLECLDEAIRLAVPLMTDDTRPYFDTKAGGEG